MWLLSLRSCRIWQVPSPPRICCVIKKGSDPWPCPRVLSVKGGIRPPSAEVSSSSTTLWICDSIIFVYMFFLFKQWYRLMVDSFSHLNHILFEVWSSSCVSPLPQSLEWGPSAKGMLTACHSSWDCPDDTSKDCCVLLYYVGVCSSCTMNGSLQILSS